MVATESEVESTIDALIRRFHDVQPHYRAMLPSRRTIEAECPDLDTVWHAHWRNGELSEVREGASERRPDIRIIVDSDDLVAMARGELDFGRAWSQDRVKLKASMTDLLRLRAVL